MLSFNSKVKYEVVSPETQGPLLVESQVNVDPLVWAKKTRIL